MTDTVLLAAQAYLWALPLVAFTQWQHQHREVFGATSYAGVLDDRPTSILVQASAAGELMAQANTFAKRIAGSRYWPDRRWDLAISAAMKSQTPGNGQAYLGCYTDADGSWLDGDRSFDWTWKLGDIERAR